MSVYLCISITSNESHTHIGVTIFVRTFHRLPSNTILTHKPDLDLKAVFLLLLVFPKKWICCKSFPFFLQIFQYSCYHEDITMHTQSSSETVTTKFHPPRKKFKSAVWDYFGYARNDCGVVLKDGYPVCKNVAAKHVHSSLRTPSL